MQGFLQKVILKRLMNHLNFLRSLISKGILCQINIFEKEILDYKINYLIYLYIVINFKSLENFAFHKISNQ